MNRRVVAVFILAFALLTTSAYGQEKKFEFYPGAQYDPKIPTLEQVVGHAWGENITAHAEVEKYLEALVKATPRAKLVRYGATWEGRALYYLIVASDANIARLEQVKAGMKRLADPRGLSDADAEQLVKSLPVVVWLSYGVHGNEISSTDASLLAAYHLLAAQNDDVVKQILEHDVVIFDPMQNPDGRDRFIQYFRQTRGPEPDADMLAAEHNENWPSGRVNHYLFDMNRDWFALTQLETRGRVKAILDWYPIIYVDLHEMGSNSTYYFTPPALPLNPNFTKAQVEWLSKAGQNNSEWFDRFR
ncbi:MAG TPA: M14 family zinc carboxypeptidase, partial [Candidatus Nitrosotenuis sp.]|nr:M14 family zinc carboxypeptidase [Candidatus Nitrosotenuis sp.]